MKKLFLLFALITYSFTFAINDPGDKPGKISGSVFDKKLNEPIPYVTIVVKTLSNEIITGGVTDENGNFEIKDIPEGPSNISIQYIGYKIYSLEIIISDNNRNIQMGKIFLEEDVASLDEVTVVAERSTIEQKLDRKIINVGKDLTTAGPTASEIMNNLPAVSVDPQTGEISLRGNQNVRVMVDGKLSNVPVAQLLKQIPSSSIKQIELITNPSAKYNPEGMSGIINIILHKNANIGFNGNASVGLTYEENAKFTGGIDMNYRNGKFNLYGNFNNNVSKGINRGHIERPQDNSEQNFQFLNNNKSNLFKVGLDFYLNDHNTLSFFTNQNIFDGKATGGVNIFYLNNPMFNQGQDFNTLEDNTSSQYNFDYKLNFEKEGHSLELEADYNKFSSSQDASYIFTGASPLDNYSDFDDTERDQLTVNLDYINPLSEKAKLEAGVEARLFDTKIDYSSTGQSYNLNGNLIPTPSTIFEYQRNIYSAYATYGKTFEKWSYQLGARLESVNVKADTNTVRAFTNDYIQIYPSAYVTYTPTEKNQFQISYSRRVDRPGLDQVNPIREFTTPLISSFGNISLMPQFTNSLEMNYTRNLGKGSITGGIFYRAINDEINRAVFIDRTDLNKSILTFDNFSNTNNYGVELSGNYKPTKWWSFNTSFEFYNKTQKGITEKLENLDNNPSIEDIVTETVEVNATTWNVRMFNNFSATKDLSFSLFGMYRAKNPGIQFESQPFYFVNMGARYSLWEGRGTFSINYNDVFDTMKFKFKGSNPYVQNGEFSWESNTVYVGLSYRFGGGNYKAKTRKNRDDNEKSNSGGIF